MLFFFVCLFSSEVVGAGLYQWINKKVASSVLIQQNGHFPFLFMQNSPGMNESAHISHSNADGRVTGTLNDCPHNYQPTTHLVWGRFQKASGLQQILMLVFNHGTALTITKHLASMNIVMQFGWSCEWLTNHPLHTPVVLFFLFAGY